LDGLTICFLSIRSVALSYSTLVLQINIPAVCLPLFIFQRECKYGISLLDGVLPFGIVGFEGAADGIEGLGRWKGVFRILKIDRDTRIRKIAYCSLESLWMRWGRLEGLFKDRRKTRSCRNYTFLVQADDDLRLT